MRTSFESREVLRLAVPIALAQVGLMIIGLTDIALAGRVSASDLAAVAMGNSLSFAMQCPAMGIAMAVEPLASQAVGAGDQEGAWQSFRAGVAACVLLSVPTMMVMAASPLLLELFGVDASVAPMATRFMLARVPGVVPWLLFMAAKAYLQARGVTRPLYVAGGLAIGVNLVVCVALMFGDRAMGAVGLPPLGLSLGSLGAGVAMTMASVALAVVGLGATWRIRPAGASPGGGSESLRAMTTKLIWVGVPIGVQILAEVGAFSVVGLLVARLGSVPMAAHQVALGLANFTFMGAQGVSGATSVLVGRAVGARDARGVRRAGVEGGLLGVGYMALWGLVFVLAPWPLVRLFSPDPAVLEVAVTLLRVAAAFQIFDGIQSVAGGALRGAADTRFASWANVACHWGVGLPTAMLFGLGLGYGVSGFWWGLSTGLMTAAVALSLRFWWLSSRVIAAV